MLITLLTVFTPWPVLKWARDHLPVWSGRPDGPVQPVPRAPGEPGAGAQRPAPSAACAGGPGWVPLPTACPSTNGDLLGSRLPRAQHWWQCPGTWCSGNHRPRWRKCWGLWNTV